MTHPQWAQDALSKWREQRSPEALGELLKAQRDRAYALAIRLTASPEDAEDVVQEAFVKLMSREKGFGSLEEFDTTVHRAVFQCAMDALRSGARRARREARAGLEAAAAALPKPGTEAEMLGNETSAVRAKLRTAVQELPEEARHPAVLCYYQGLSEEQAAEVLAVPRSTLRRRLAQAVSSLRRRLASDDARVSAAMLLALMAGEPAGPAPASLCAALDRVLPGKACALVPALPATGGAAAAPAATLGAKMAVAALAAACAGLLALWLGAAGPGGDARPAASAPLNPPMTSHPERADVRPGGGDQEVAARPGRAEEEEAMVMDGKLKGLAALAGGMILSGVAGAAEPSADVAAVIAKIQARQVAKAEAAAKDAAERVKLYGQYGERTGGYYGQ